MRTGQRTTIVIDQEKLAAASKLLKTKNMTETVDAALEEVINKRRLESLIESSISHRHVDRDALARARADAWR